MRPAAILRTALLALFVYFPQAGPPLLGGGEPTQGFTVYSPRLTGSCGEELCNVSRERGMKSEHRKHHAFPGKYVARSRFSSVRVLVPGELFPSKRIALSSPEPWLQIYNPHLIRFLVQSGIAVGEPIFGIQKIIPNICAAISFFEHLIIRDYWAIFTVT